MWTTGGMSQIKSTKERKEPRGNLELVDGQMGRWMDRSQRERKRVRRQNTLHKGTYTVARHMRHSISWAIPLFPFSMGSWVWWEKYLTSGRRGVECFAAAIGAFASDPAFALVAILDVVASHCLAQIRILAQDAMAPRVQQNNGPSSKIINTWKKIYGSLLY